jgi:hypothetical protein
LKLGVATHVCAAFQKNKGHENVGIDNCMAKRFDRFGIAMLY